MLFCESVRRAIRNNDITTIQDGHVDWYYRDGLYQMLKNHESLYNNIIQENFIVRINLTGEQIEFKKGAKMMRPLRKLAVALQIENAFEDFRLSQSMVHNDDRLIGNLCLSIHPLDFMTMSDNDYDWDSCMSWKHCGDYRSGTVEIMNSPCVLVAYLEGDKPFYLDGNNKWNNKKWRILTVVDKSLICSIKAYPYHNDNLIEEVMKFICELAEENWGITYESVDDLYRPNLHDFTEEFWLGKWPGTEDYYKIYFHTNKMYNDFGRTTHYMYVNRAAGVLNGDYNWDGIESYWDSIESYWDDDAKTSVTIKYHGVELFIGGKFNCMWCGETDSYAGFEHDSSVLCQDCCEIAPNYIAACEECGCGIEDGDDYVYVRGAYYCENCGCRIAHSCSACGDWDYNENFKPMLISYKDVKWNDEKIKNYNEIDDSDTKLCSGPLYCRSCYNRVIENLNNYNIDTSNLLWEEDTDNEGVPYVRRAIDGDALIEAIKSRKENGFFNEFTSVFRTYHWSFYDWWYRYFSGNSWTSEARKKADEKFNQMIITIKEEFPYEREVSMFRLRQ